MTSAKGFSQEPVSQDNPQKKDIVEPQALNPAEDTTEPPKHKPKFGFNLYYSTADTAKFDNTVISTSSGSATATTEFKSSGSAGIGMFIADTKPESWGYSGSLLYEPDRDISSVTFSNANATVTAAFSGIKPKFSVLILEGTVIYRWNSFYLPFGLNLSAPKLTTSSGSGTSSLSGGVGAFLGAGFITTENSSVEIFSRSITLKYSESAGTTNVDCGTGYLAGLGFGWKYWFP